ncbi:cell division protein FtsL, partial [Patescibacteria group bacterium]|nr:cell division protein FtsL [Patescibacteria group bacterium]MBU1783258.1 cell division protein FtsL [Patescibacteria group bacterium]
SKFLNLKIINLAILFIIIVSGVYYLIGTNDLTVKGFSQEKLREKNRQLAKENENLELSITSLSSYNNINSRIKNLKMVAVNNVDYLEVGVNVVARR